jgi:hypothetical protein
VRQNYPTHPDFGFASCDRNEQGCCQAQIRLTPGVAVFRKVLANIDTDGDGVISEAEQRAYAERVLQDLSLTIDGARLRLRLVSSKFPRIEEMKEGVGNILIELDADLPRGGPNRRLIFENQHQNRIAAYLVNCLVPGDPDIRITAQNRNYRQSFYQLDYVQDNAPLGHVQAVVRSNPQFFPWWLSARGWIGATALVLFAVLLLLWWRPSVLRIMR